LPAIAIAALLLLILLACTGRAPASAAASGQQLYVAPTGSDRNEGLSSGRPLRTVTAALARAGPGTVITLLPGTYAEQLVTRRAGQPGAPIIIRGEGRQAIIDGSRLASSLQRDQNVGLVELRHDHVQLIGLSIVKAPGTAILLAANDLLVEDNRVSDAQLHGISTHTDRQTNYRGRPGTMISRIRLIANLVERAPLARQGQAISLIADDFEVRGNHVRNSPREGIDIWLGARRGKVVDNVVHDNRAAGIYVDGASDVLIHRNRVYRNGSGIGVSSEDVNYRTRGVVVANNIVQENQDAGIFLWDDGSDRGFVGVQEVSILHNTLVGNRYAIYLSGRSNTGWIANNLGQSRRAPLSNNARNSSFRIEGNLWLKNRLGVIPINATNLQSRASPGRDRGQQLLGRTPNEQAVISADIRGRSRPRGRAPDAGAFEHDSLGL
jgi:parallel beta-helix repeat protein